MEWNGSGMMHTESEVEMASQKSRKRDREGGFEKVGFFPVTKYLEM